jgi:hypothetical protein
MIQDDFDPNKISFDVEVNELALRLTALQRASKEITETDLIPSNNRLDVLANLQAEINHIKKIFNVVFYQKKN